MSLNPQRVYMSGVPMLVVAEPHLIRNILVKDFHNFVNRRDFKTDDQLLDRALTTVMDDEWKRLRSVVRSLLQKRCD